MLVGRQIQALRLCLQITVDGQVVTDPDTILRYFIHLFAVYIFAARVLSLLSPFIICFTSVASFLKHVMHFIWILFFSDGSKLVYHRLAWQEPSAPHLLQVLYEDEDMVCTSTLNSC